MQQPPNGRRRRTRRAATALVGCALVMAFASTPPASARPGGTPAFVDGHVLLGFKSGVSVANEHAAEASAHGTALETIGEGTTLLSVPRGSVQAAVATLRANGAVSYAEPDYVLTLASVPNDPDFDDQWGLQNTGQTLNGTTGTAGDDVSAPAAWDVTTGNASIVVAVLDSGVDYTHQDLRGNIWTNPGGVLGCPAGTHGFQALSGTSTAGCDPMDVFGHGTHVAGILGAVGDNGVGVSGVDPTVTMLPVKWTNDSGMGSVSLLIKALKFVVKAQKAGVNVRVVNDSAVFAKWKSSTALLKEINAVSAAGILFVTAAGNQNTDNDTMRRYPCDYGTANEICVGASDQNDRKASFSNWGSSTVDLFAPGQNIFSTVPNDGYGFMSGTSMATPFVSGAAALVLSQDPNDTVSQLKSDLLNSVDVRSALQGLARTNGRLNVCAALSGCASS